MNCQVACGRVPDEVVDRVAFGENAKYQVASEHVQEAFATRVVCTGNEDANYPVEVACGLRAVCSDVPGISVVHAPHEICNEEEHFLVVHAHHEACSAVEHFLVVHAHHEVCSAEEHFLVVHAPHEVCSAVDCRQVVVGFHGFCNVVELLHEAEDNSVHKMKEEEDDSNHLIPRDDCRRHKGMQVD